MASIKYFIRSSSKKPSKIRIRLRAGRDIDLYGDTLQVIDPDNWDPKKEKVKIKLEVRNADEINKNLRDLKSFVEDEELRLTDKLKLTKEWLDKIIDKFYNPEKYKPKKETLFSFIESFIKKADKRINPRTGRPVSYKMIREYERTFELLKEYAEKTGKEPNFQDIDLYFYDDFIAFLQIVDSSLSEKTRDGKMREKKLSTNTIGKKIQTLKIFLNDASERGINTNLKYKSNKFISVTEQADTFYLNEKELDQLYQFDFSQNKRLEHVRDLFLIGCWTGLRFSDLSKLSVDNIKNGFCHVTQQKTGGKVIIPVHPVVRAIFDKYEGNLPGAISNQKFNDYLKEAAEIAGINEEIHKAITRGGQKISKKYRKHEVLTTHAARRSFATNLYKSGFPAQSIMAITGHKTEAAFLKYLKVTPEEHAKLLQDYWLKNGSHLKVV
jgi:integrase